MKEDNITSTFMRLQAKEAQVFLSKYSARGHENISEQGFTGVFTRMRHDKMARLSSVAKAHQLAAAFPDFDIDKYMADNCLSLDDVVDDLLDISNYAKMAIMLLRGEWKP